MYKFILNSVLKKYAVSIGAEDPYYDYVPVNNDKTKFKKVPRLVPDNLSTNDQAILRKFKKRAHRYDMFFSLFGVTFGFNNLAQLVPVLGPIITTYWSVNLLVLAYKLDNGFPLDLSLWFVLNIAIDIVLGLIPIVGSIVSVGFKCNSRNYLLLDKYLFRISDYNSGVITREQIRPGFLNDKVQPLLFKLKKIEPIELKTLRPSTSFTSIKSQLMTNSTASSSTVGTSPATVSLRKDHENHVHTVN